MKEGFDQFWGGYTFLLRSCTDLMEMNIYFSCVCSVMMFFYKLDYYKNGVG